MAIGYYNEPNFRWWMHKELNKHDRFVKRVKSRNRNNKFKFGVGVFLIVEDALWIDWENGNTLWNDYIGKYMKNSRVSLNSIDRDNHAPVGYKEITCHLIIGVKMVLTRKYRYVAGGNITDPHYSMNYSSVVSFDSVLLALFISAMNYLNILAGDIQNSYLNALTKEKVFYYASDEWKYDPRKSCYYCYIYIWFKVQYFGTEESSL